MAGKPRVLFIAEAVTLAHVARIFALANAIDDGGFEIRVATHPRYARLFGDTAFAVQDIETISAERFADAIAKGAPIYDVETIESYVEEDLRLIRHFAPDLIVGDFRLSLSISARLAATTYLTVTNAGWSPFAQTRFVVPELPITRWFGTAVAQALFTVARPIAFASHARALNRVRRRHGLDALPPDIRATYVDADFVLYADLPELFRMKPLPANHLFIGPVPWSAPGSLPDGFDRSAEHPPHLPVVYVTFGSSGQSDLLPGVLRALGTMPVRVIAATAGRVSLGLLPSNVFAAAYVPGDVAAEAADLVICNGGSPTCYQALAAGKPILAIPSNLDQFLNMEAIRRSRAGCVLRQGQVSQRSIPLMVGRLLDEPSFGRSARDLKKACARYDASSRFHALVSKLTVGKPGPDVGPAEIGARSLDGVGGRPSIQQGR